MAAVGNATMRQGIEEAVVERMRTLGGCGTFRQIADGLRYSVPSISTALRRLSFKGEASLERHDGVETWCLSDQV